MSAHPEARNYKLDHKLRVPKTQDILDQMHLFDVDLKSNHIYLMSVDRGYDASGDNSEPGIDYVIANRFVRNFNLCMRVNPESPVLIHQKTNGGVWEEGMAIYDTIRSTSQLVTILNYTHARSMSSIIFQAANKRVMMPHSYFLFHDGTFGMEGTVKQIRSAVDYDKTCSDRMIDIYVKSMKRAPYWKGKTDKQIASWLKSEMEAKEDVYLNASDTVKFGFADEIFDYNWENLTKYTNEQSER
jgi:ATP-dependent protease ClpP protease subunit